MKNLESIRCDLAAYRITLGFAGGAPPLSVHFDTPSRRFYFSIIALMIVEMKKRGRHRYFHVHRYKNILAKLDKSLSGKNASGSMDGMLAKIKMAWLHRMPDLASAVLFKVFDRDLVSPYEKGGRHRYQCSEVECDTWANLFGYDENNTWRFKFPSDSNPIDLNDISISLGKLRDDSAWEEFIHRLDIEHEAPKPPEKENPLPPAVPEPEKTTVRTRIRKRAWMTAAAFTTAILAVFVWQIYSIKAPESIDKIDLGHGVYPEAGKPSIAVLPLDNMTKDPGQNYFCDGLADQIITALSQVPFLYVAARTSSFAFKGKNFTTRQIAGRLGVGYLLEGSLQQDAGRLRINVQLIDGGSGTHIWAEYYDPKDEDLFAIQDEIAMKVLAAMNIEVTGFISARLKNIRPNNLKAYGHFLKGLYFHLGRRPEDIEKARSAFNEAIDLDPNFAKAYMLLGLVDMDEITIRKAKTPEKFYQSAKKMAQKAMALDPDNPPYALWSWIYRGHDHEKAVYYGKKGVEQAPNDPYRYHFLCLAQRFAGEYADALVSAKTALTLTPFRPAHFLNNLAWSYALTRQYPEAISVFEEIIEKSERSLYGFVAYLGLAAAYELTGNHEKARWAAGNVMQRNPKFTLQGFRKANKSKNTNEKEMIYDACRRAGLR